MIKNENHFGKNLNCLSKVYCDSCGQECTDNFIDIYFNFYHDRRIEETTTSQQPFSQIKVLRKQYCKICIDKINIC